MPEAPMVDIPYEREFPHAIDSCYEWLTDYTDKDPSLTPEILRNRRVIERHPDRVIMDVENVFLGRALKGRAEVKLYPKEHRYEARSLHGDGKAILYTYQLTPLAPNRTRLEIHYKTRVRKLGRRLQLRILRPLIRTRIHRMWEGFATAMANDLAASEPPRLQE